MAVRCRSRGSIRGSSRGRSRGSRCDRSRGQSRGTSRGRSRGSSKSTPGNNIKLAAAPATAPGTITHSSNSSATPPFPRSSPLLPPSPSPLFASLSTHLKPMSFRFVIQVYDVVDCCLRIVICGSKPPRLQPPRAHGACPAHPTVRLRLTAAMKKAETFQTSVNEDEHDF